MQHTNVFDKTKEASTAYISHFLTARSYHFMFDLFWSLWLANDLFLQGFDTLSHLFVRMFILVPTTAKSTISQSSCFETQNFPKTLWETLEICFLHPKVLLSLPKNFMLDIRGVVVF